MPVINIDDNIKQLTNKIEQMTQELFRMQGVMQTFQGFKSGGLENIELPNNPKLGVGGTSEIEELESTQEKPQ
jgi:hypothetical protein